MNLTQHPNFSSLTQMQQDYITYQFQPFVNAAQNDAEALRLYNLGLGYINGNT